MTKTTKSKPGTHKALDYIIAELAAAFREWEAAGRKNVKN